MDLRGVNTIYFLGIGGIGMSALARYFAAKGYRVCGYDRTASNLTTDLQRRVLWLNMVMTVPLFRN